MRLQRACSLHVHASTAVTGLDSACIQLVACTEHACMVCCNEHVWHGHGADGLMGRSGCCPCLFSCSTGPCWHQRWSLCWGSCCPSPASCCSWHWNTCLTCPQGAHAWNWQCCRHVPAQALAHAIAHDRQHGQLLSYIKASAHACLQPTAARLLAEPLLAPTY